MKQFQVTIKGLDTVNEIFIIKEKEYQRLYLKLTNLGLNVIKITEV